MSDPVPTIEWVAEQLGEPQAHLAPYQTNVGTFPDEMQRAVWWAVFGWSEDIARRVTSKPIMWTDEDGNDQALAGPTRDDALQQAAKALQEGRFGLPVAFPERRDQRPTLYVTNGSSRKLHGPGKRLHIMAAPRDFEQADDSVPVLKPNLDDLYAVKGQRITFSQYKRRYEDTCPPVHQLVPGKLLTDRYEPVADGDTLYCACSKADAAAGKCHRVWAAEALAMAGWRIILDGVDLSAAPEPTLFESAGGAHGR